MEGIKQVPQSDLAKLVKKNQLLDVLGNEGQQIVVVGDTSTGKSTVINFLLGFPINFEASGIGTRRPCVLTQIQKPGLKKVQFSARFCKGGDTLQQDLTEDVNAVAKIVQAANDHHHLHYFSCLDPEATVNEAERSAFDGEPVYVQMYHEDFKYGLRLVDLPGLTRSNNNPMAIARTYIQPGNVAVLVMGRDNAANGGFPELAEAMCACEQVLVIQNFAFNLLKTSHNAQDNFDKIKTTFEEKRSGHAESLKVMCVDFGLPKVSSMAHLWKASTAKDVGDQEDWQGIAQSGGLEVQVKMYKHACAWGAKLKKECEKEACRDGRDYDWGILPVLNRIVEFQIYNIDAQITDLKERVKRRIEKQGKHLEEVKEIIKRLEDPPEWQDLLSRLATVISEYLDTTIAIPTEADEPGGKAFEKALMSTNGEIDATIAFFSGMAKEPARTNPWQDPYNPVDFGKRSNFHWFNDDLDARIREVVSKPLDSDRKMCNLKSWQRLLDELTAMLAFAPMPYILQSKKLLAYKRIAKGAGAEMSPLDNMVTLVSEAKLDEGAADGKIPIWSLLQTFKWRFLYMAHRDIDNCLEIFKRDDTHEISRFLELLEEDTPAMRNELCEDLKKQLNIILRRTVTRFIDGEYQLEKNKEPVMSYGKALKKDRSGLCVRATENDPMVKGACWWLLPFKAHYVNGQIPWKDLLLRGQPTPPGKDNPWFDDLTIDKALEEINTANSMNAVSGVNMNIFNYATHPYDVILCFDEDADDKPVYNIDLEVMKMLKALQAEIAAFWASAWKSMIQQMKDETACAEELMAHIHRHLGESGLHHGYDHEPSKADMLRAVNGVVNWISGVNYPDCLYKTTAEEIREIEEHDLSSYPWPGLDMVTFKKIMKEFTEKPPPDFNRETFPFTAEEKVCGEFAWIRLSEEFIFVVLQLAMARATPAEVMMAKASCGKVTAASAFEIVTKLVLHRLNTLGQKSGDIFRLRLLRLYRVDLDCAMEEAKKRGIELQDFSCAGQSGFEFVKGFLMARAERVVDRTLASLRLRFTEMLPLDFSILNGRLQLLDRPLRKGDYELVNGKPQVYDDRMATASLEKCWKQSLLAQWEPGIEGKLIVEADPNVTTRGQKASELVLAPETNGFAFECLNDRKAIKECQDFGTASDMVSAPAPNMASGPFHSMLLKVHKAMHVEAIDHCRPKLKDMMSHLYQQDKIRHALVRSKFTAKEAFATTAKKRDHEAREIEAKIANMEKVLRELDGGGPGGAEAQESQGAALPTPGSRPGRAARSERPRRNR